MVRVKVEEDLDNVKIIINQTRIEPKRKDPQTSKQEKLEHLFVMCHGMNSSLCCARLI
jgi:hypothetical protein